MLAAIAKLLGATLTFVSKLAATLSGIATILQGIAIIVGAWA